MIAGTICGVLGLLSLVLAVLLCRRYSQDRNRHFVNEKFYPGAHNRFFRNEKYLTLIKKYFTIAAPPSRSTVTWKWAAGTRAWARTACTPSPCSCSPST